MKIVAPFQRKRARIEIIPLIDIIFFLLATFVMVSLSMVKNQGVMVRLPTAVSSTPQQRDLIVTISITEDGRLFLDKEEIAIVEVKERLSVLKLDHPELTVFINGDERADFGKAVQLLDEVRQLGIDKVAIQTKNKS